MLYAQRLATAALHDELSTPFVGDGAFMSVLRATRDLVVDLVTCS
jgi:hypothetical protein